MKIESYEVKVKATAKYKLIDEIELKMNVEVKEGDYYTLYKRIVDYTEKLDINTINIRFLYATEE